VDLEKSFDMFRHELLFELLEIYGIPEDMMNVIQRLYKNVTLKLNSGSPKDLISYSVGVRQGDRRDGAPSTFHSTHPSNVRISGRQMGSSGHQIC
jgi:hypothetical protein